MSIDKALTTAAKSLHESIQQTPLPIGLPRDRRPRHVVTAAAGITLVGIAVAVAMLVKVDSHDRARPAVETPETPTASTHFRLANPPDGMVVQVVTDQGSSATRTGLGGLYDQRYIRFERTKPIGQLDILTGPTPGDTDLRATFFPLAGGLGYPVDNIQVRGHPGIRIGPVIAWQEFADQVVAIRGPDDLDQLQDIASGLQRRAATGYQPTVLPAHYEHVGDLPPSYTEHADSTVQYGQSRGPQRLKISVVKDPPLPLLAEVTTDPTSETSLLNVRGHQAVLSTGPFGQSLSWDEQPGLRITVSATGLSTERLSRIARQLESQTTRQWRNYGAPHSSLLNGATPESLTPLP